MNTTRKTGDDGGVSLPQFKTRIVSKEALKDSPFVIVNSSGPSLVQSIEHPGLLSAVRKIAPDGEELNRFVRWRRQDLLHGTLNEALEIIRLQDPEQTAHRDFDEITTRANANQIDTLITLLRNSVALNQKASIADMLISIDEEAFISQYLIPVLERKAGFIENDLALCQSLLNALSDEDLEAMFRKIDFNAVTDFDNMAESISQLEDPYRIVNALLNIVPSLPDFESHTEETYQQTKQIQLIALRIIERSKPPTLSPNGSKSRQDPVETLYRSSVDLGILFGAGNHLITQRGKQAVPIIHDVIWEEGKPDDYMSVLKRFYAISQYVNLLKDEAAPELKKFILENENVELVQIASFHLANSCGQEGKASLGNVIYEQIVKEKPSIPLAFLSSVAKEHDLFSALLQMVFAMPFTNGQNLVRAYELASEIKACKIVKDGGKFSLVTTDPNPNLASDVLNDLGLIRLSEWCIPITDPQFITISVNNRLKGVLKSNVRTLFQYAMKSCPERMNGLVLGGLALQDNLAVKAFLLAMGDIANFGRPIDESLVNAIEGPDLSEDSHVSFAG